MMMMMHQAVSLPDCLCRTAAVVFVVTSKRSNVRSAKPSPGPYSSSPKPKGEATKTIKQLRTAAASKPCATDRQQRQDFFQRKYLAYCRGEGGKCLHKINLAQCMYASAIS